MRVMALHRDERGANAVIVAILLVALLGMLSLSVDGGFLYAKFRGIRNANDAAALAAALSCGKKEGQGTATTQADTFARDNVGNAIEVPGLPPVYTPSCDASAGTVTVHYQGQQTLYFSPVVGVTSPKTVSAAATAAWGVAGGASNVSPLMLSMNRLSNCNVPYGPGLVVGVTKCAFYWNNDPSVLGNAAWGLMNLSEWNVAPTFNCSNAGQSSYATWLLNGFPGSLVLNDPPPTYVCRDSGNFGGALDNDIQRAIAANHPYAFPVDDQTKQIDRNGNICPPPNCTPDKYYIAGFAWLQLADLCTGTGGGRWNCSDPNDLTLCSQFQADSNTRCLVSVWEGFTTTGLDPGGGGTFGNVLAVALKG